MRCDDSKRIFVCVLLGLVVGLLVLGLGGRVLMRLLAFVTPEAPRFTLGGTLLIVGSGAVWGGITAPLLLPAERWRSRLGRLFGTLFGLAVMILALFAFMVFSGFDGSIVAPKSFVLGTVLLFPLLFVLHGVVLESLLRNYFSLNR